MRAALLPLALAIAALGTGCDSRPKEPPPDLIKSQRRALEKAQGVGDVLQKSADERRERSERE